MRVKSIAAAFVTMVVALAAVQPSVSAAGDRAVAPERWIKLAGTSGRLNDVKGPVRLASYSLVFDAGQGHYGYLREGDRFVKTRYREALVAPGERWAAGIPHYQLWVAVKTIDLIDRVRDWDVGRRFRFYFAGDAGGVMAMHDAAGGRIAVYGLDGQRRRFYTGVGALDESSTVTPFSPSGQLFATFFRRPNDDVGWASSTRRRGRSFTGSARTSAPRSASSRAGTTTTT